MLWFSSSSGATAPRSSFLVGSSSLPNLYLHLLQRRREGMFHKCCTGLKDGDAKPGGSTNHSFAFERCLCFLLLPSPTFPSPNGVWDDAVRAGRGWGSKDLSGVLGSEALMGYLGWVWGFCLGFFRVESPLSPAAFPGAAPPNWLWTLSAAGFVMWHLGHPLSETGIVPLVMERFPSQKSIGKFRGGVE